jgi:hypothetical protein
MHKYTPEIARWGRIGRCAKIIITEDLAEALSTRRGEVEYHVNRGVTVHDE